MEVHSPSHDSHKAQQQHGRSASRQVSIDKTAANEIKNQIDKERAYEIIVLVFSLFGKNLRTMLRADNQQAGYHTITFLDVPAKIPGVSISDLGRIVRGYPLDVRDIRIRWKKSYEETSFIKIDLDLWKAGASKADTPQFKLIHYRKSMFEEAIKHAKLDRADLPASWNADLITLKDVAYAMYNMLDASEHPRLMCSLTPVKAVKKYILRFQNVNKLCYSFLEYLFKEFHPKVLAAYAGSESFKRQLTIEIGYGDSSYVVPTFPCREGGADHTIPIGKTEAGKRKRDE
jgi:hypothetical protein